MVAMTKPAETRRLLRITFEGDSVRGSLDDDAELARPFVGWLELLAAIQELRTDADGPGPVQPSR
jgi:hypothetical protein